MEHWARRRGVWRHDWIRSYAHRSKCFENFTGGISFRREILWSGNEQTDHIPWLAEHTPSPVGVHRLPEGVHYISSESDSFVRGRRIFAVQYIHKDWNIAVPHNLYSQGILLFRC